MRKCINSYKWKSWGGSSSGRAESACDHLTSSFLFLVSFYSQTDSKVSAGLTSKHDDNWGMKDMVLAESSSRRKNNSRRNLIKRLWGNLLLHWYKQGHMSFFNKSLVRAMQLSLIWPGIIWGGELMLTVLLVPSFSKKVWIPKPEFTKQAEWDKYMLDRPPTAAIFNASFSKWAYLLPFVITSKMMRKLSIFVIWCQRERNFFLVKVIFMILWRICLLANTSLTWFIILGNFNIYINGPLMTGLLTALFSICEWPCHILSIASLSQCYHLDLVITKTYTLLLILTSNVILSLPLQ